VSVLDLGINTESISYEVALEVLGQSRQPFMQVIHDERRTADPSQALFRFCEARLSEIDELQENLQPSDRVTIERILSEDDPVFRVR